jgi:hypothetical protein
MSEKKENPGECECCNFVTQELTLYENQDTCIAAGGYGKTRKADFWFCELCAGSMASTHYRYLNEDYVTLSVICNVGNAIIAAIRSKP